MREYQEDMRELSELRQVYYTLLVRFFWKEPEEEFLASLREGLPERVQAAGQLHPLIGEGWEEIGGYLDSHPPEEVANEFTKMFLGPHQPPVAPYESFYLAGSLYKEPLIKVREFMRAAGLAKKDDEHFPEPEDILTFELEIMNWLVTKELAAKNPKDALKWLERQAEFFKTHLQVWSPQCAKDIVEAEYAEFYKGAGKILQGFLELETLHFQDMGPEKVETLAEARKRLGKQRTFKGEVYDPDPLGDPANPVEN